MTTPPPSSTLADFQRAFEHHTAGRLAEAADLYRRIVAVAPGHADALHLLGSIEAQGGNPAEGVRLIGEALRIQPDAALMWSNHGNALSMLGRKQEAIESYERATALAPDLVAAQYSLCGLLIAEGDATRALTAMDRALAATPGQHVLLTGRANALSALRRLDDALAGYEAVIATAPRNIDALRGKGTVLAELGKPHEALAAFDRALALLPGHLDSVLGRAHAQVMTGAAAQALETLDRVIAVVPRDAMAHYVRGHALLALLRTRDAAESFRQSAEIAPGMTLAVYNYADTLRALGAYDEAMPVFERVLEQDPDHTHAMSGLAACAMQCCDWTIQQWLAPLIEAKVRAGSRGVMPFTFLTLSSEQDLQLACSRTFIRYGCPQSVTPLPAKPPRRGDKIRIGYLSSDFRRHAMAYQMAELFELHDRSRFEVVGFSGGADDGSPIRRRIEAAFDELHDVVGRPSEDVARCIHDCDIDVAIDLNGNTMHTLIGALAWRPARAQATYLGFPGSSGASFIDYVIADATVAPFEDQPFYTERIVHLPGCYQVSDRQRKAAGFVPSRAVAGLPAQGFVFCCFNSSYKISPEIFASWMRILAATPGSVLWLVRGNAAMVANLRRQAHTRGIDPDRLVFCGMVEPDEHLARHALADLYLDTLPYNSHGTGSFALWGGLPMLTVLGPTFCGRVAASLLQAAGLPELVTSSIAEYEAAAIALAGDRQRLAALRARLARSRETAPLFDTDLFRRHIEAAYTTMHETKLRSEPPRSFTVEK
jgi:protein O-GlcNAc transferase